MTECIESILRRSILRRRRSPFDKSALFASRFLAPQLRREVWDPLGELLQQTRITLLAYSDCDLDLFRRQTWGDHWFKRELLTAAGRLGYLVVDAHLVPDVVIHLWGQPTCLPGSGTRLLWIHSNPDKITPSVLSQYDKIYCVSNVFATEIRRMGYPCEVLQQGTSKRRVLETKLKYDVVFVGNARFELGGTRPIVDAMGKPDIDFKVWGTGYRTLPARYWVGAYFENSELDALYAASRISLNDHRPAMAAAGFINPRVFDILAAGGFCISDPNPAITDLFGDAVPQYSSPAHLRELIAYYLDHEEERQILAQRGHVIAIQYTWEKVAAALLEGISPAYGA